MVEKAESSQGTSDDLKTQIEEQTSELEEGEVQEEEDSQEETQAEEEETETDEEEATEETSDEETTEKPKSQAKETKSLHKIKVEGKEENVPYEKLIEYAQKGRYLEREMSKIKQEKERLKETSKEPKPFSPDMDITKINERFVEELQKDPFGTMVRFHDMAESHKDERNKAERIADKEFEVEKKAEVPHWSEIKETYKEFREIGFDREEAFLRAENDYIKSILATAVNKGRKEGESKAKAKAKAELPVKEKLTKTKGIPSAEDLSKLSSKDISKHLRYIKNANW